jgi:hypothetical protein
MLWRALLAAGGVCILIGGPKHPGGTMLEMLQHPDWLFSHVMVTLGYIGLLGGLVVFSRSYANTPPLRRWTNIAMAGTALMTLEMIMHTAAMVDADHLAAGHSTPILSTHLAMAVMFYPVFGVTSALFMWKAAQARAMGSPWFAWLGMICVLAQGVAPGLVLSGFEGARILFPLITGLALWMVLSAAWPAKATAGKPAIAV